MDVLPGSIAIEGLSAALTELSREGDGRIVATLELLDIPIRNVDVRALLELLENFLTPIAGGSLIRDGWLEDTDLTFRYIAGARTDAATVKILSGDAELCHISADIPTLDNDIRVIRRMID